MGADKKDFAKNILSVGVKFYGGCVYKITPYSERISSIAQSLTERTDYAKNPEKTIVQIITGSTNYAANPDTNYCVLRRGTAYAGKRGRRLYPRQFDYKYPRKKYAREKAKAASVGCGFSTSKKSAKTLIFLKENGIDSYDDSVKKSSFASGGFSALTKKIKDAEKRMTDISELQKQISTYGKTCDIYSQYIKSGRREKFYGEHRADITLHQAARKYFDERGYNKDMNKLLMIASLKQE